MLILSSCSSTKPAIKGVAPNIDNNPVVRPMSAPKLYLRLIKEDDIWTFSEMVDSAPKQPDANGVSVDFFTLEPMLVRRNDRFVVTCFRVPVAHCEATLKTRAEPQGRKIAKRKKDFYEDIVCPAFGPFYSASVNKLMTGLLNTAGIVMSYGMSAGSSDSTMQFNNNAFIEAVQQAAITSGLTHSKRERIANSFRERRIPATTFNVQDNSGLYCGQPECLHIRVSRDTSNHMTSSLQALMTYGQNDAKSVTYIITCSQSTDYNVTVDCPGKLNDDLLSQQQISIPVIVNSKKTVRLSYPKHFAMENNDLKLSIDAEGLHIINKTDSYIMLDALSGIFSDRSLTTSLNQYQLPPHSDYGENFRPVGIFPKKTRNGEPLNIRKDTTKQKLEEESITVGLAVKYSTQYSNRKKTLFAEKVFSAYELVE